MRYEQQNIQLPSIAELGWVFSFFKFIWIPVLLSIVLQFLLSFTSIYSIEALNIAASVVDEGQEINTESLLYRLFIPKVSEAYSIIVISCMLAIIFTSFATVFEIIIAWTISWNQAILNNISTPKIIKKIITSKNKDDVKREESTIIQRWLILRSIADFYHNVFANSIGAIFNLGMLILFTYMQNAMAGTCLVVIISVWFIILYFFSPIVLKKSQNFAAYEEIVGKSVRSAVSLSDVLKSEDIMKRFLSFATPNISKYSKTINSLGVWGSILYGVLSGLASLAPIIVVVFTVFLSNDIELSVTTAATLYLFASKISSPLTSIARVIPVLQNQRIDFVRFRNVFGTISIDEKIGKNIFIKEFNSLIFEDIEVSYDKNKQLNFPSFEVEKGKIVCLSGVSGVGKTTLLKLISGHFDNPVKVKINNSIEVYTEDLGDFVAYLAQEPKLAELSINDNLLLFSNTLNISNIFLQEIFDDITSQLSKGTKTVITSDVNGLSVGQRRAISLINILNTQKPIIILDEPLSNLDETLQNKLWKVIKEDAKERIVIVSLHEKKYIQECDKIINL